MPKKWVNEIPTTPMPEQEERTFIENAMDFGALVENRWSSVINDTDFEAVPDFNVNDEKYKYVFRDVHPDAKREVLDAAPESPSEAMYLAKRYNKQYQLQEQLGSQGIGWTLASEFTSPESALALAAGAAVEWGTAGLATPVVGTALSGTRVGRAVNLAVKGYQGSSRVRMGADIVAGEAGYALGSQMFNEGTSGSEMTENALIGMGMGGALMYAPAAYRSLASVRQIGGKQRTFGQALENDIKNARPETGWTATIHRKLTRTESETLTDMAGAVFTSPVNKRSGEAVEAAADVEKQMRFDGLRRRVNKDINNAIDNIYKKRGVKWHQLEAKAQTFRNVEEELYEHLVVQERSLDEIADPDVRRIADAIMGDNGLYANGLKAAREGGVQGAEALEHSANYAQRRWKTDHINNLYKRFGNKETLKSLREAVTVAIQKGYVRRGLDKLDDDVAKAMARAVVRRATSVDRGFTSANDVDAADLAQMLRDVGADEDLIERAAAQLNVKKSDKPELGYLGGRIPMDLSTPIEGLDQGMRVADLMQKNLLTMGTQYANTMMGAGVLAKRGIQLSEIAAKRTAIEKELASAGRTSKEIEHIMQTFDRGVGDVMGRPLSASVDGVSPNTRRNMFRIRQAASITSLGTMGLAAIPEATAMVARTGFNQMLKAMPVLRNWSGSNRKVLLEQFEKMGVYIENPRFDNIFSSYIESGVDEGGDAIDLLLNAGASGKLGVVNMSGLGTIDRVARQHAFTSFADDVFQQAITGKKRARRVRRQELGLSQSDWDKLHEYMRNSKTTKQTGTGRDIDYFDMDKWVDEDGELDVAFQQKFAAGLHRLTNSTILNATVGERIPVTEGAVMQLFVQFRNMLVSSLDKTFLSSVRNNDAVSYANFMGGILGAFITNELKLAGKSAGASWDKYEEKLDDYSGSYNLYKAFVKGDTEKLIPALSYTLGYVPELGPVTELVSTASSTFFHKDLMGRRADVQSALFGIPATSLVESPRNAVAKMLEGEANARDVAKALPLGNTIPVMAVANTIDNLMDNE